MKKVALLFVLMLAFVAQNALAQYVTIPDVNFRNALKQQFPSCFNAANQLDTVCAGNVEVNNTWVNFSSFGATGSLYITNIEGIGFFKKIKWLGCRDTHISHLPKLPKDLEELDISDSPFLVDLNITPTSSLKILDCSFSGLTNISSLPSGLKVLDLDHSYNLTSMPILPNTIESLSIENCGFTSIQQLPSELRSLNCSFLDSLNLPELPSKLWYLNSKRSGLRIMPSLPDSLKYLDCSENLLISLPELPEGLKELRCNDNTDGNEWIPSTTWLYSLPELPSSLRYLDCSGNAIPSLHTLPDSLKFLYCSGNPLDSLPTLSHSLIELYCGNNQLVSLPTLPSGLAKLWCFDNAQLSCLPFLPPNLSSLWVSNTNITCLPNKPTALANDPLPICNPTNSNSEICPVYPRIAGYVYNDANNNGVKDAGEIPRVGVKVSILSKGFVGYSNENGFYEITVDSLKTYTASIAQLPTYYSTANLSQSVSFTAYGETVMRNFPIVPQGNIKDFKVSVNNFTAFARPGFPLHFRVKYENIGTIAGNAQVKFAHAALYNVDSTSIAHTFSNDTLVWNFSNVPAGFTGYINVYGKLSASAVLGSTQNFYAAVNQNDITDNVIADNRSNLALEVRGSFDPNDKQGTKTLTPTQVTNGEFINYTIRFQNTGTDTAFTVVVADTLANNLQANTLEMISSSHNVRTSLKGNIIYFEFLNIMLADSNVNEPRSHGFVSFRIKPQSNLTLGNTVKNKAAIYFDYNAPVITNTVTTTVAIPTGIAEKVSRRLEVYPNPLEGEMLSIPNMRGASAKLLSLEGKELRTWSNIGEQISLQNVSAGMYLLEVLHEGQRRTAKVVVK